MAGSENIRTGEAIVRLLEQLGVDVVFGIPGTHSIELYRGLQHSSIRHILSRHEQGAGFMADGYARASGRPGVCFVITGPGVTNITTAMGQAYSDSVPMLVLSPVNDGDGSHYHYGRLHEIGQQSRVTDELTAFSVTVTNAEQIGAEINRAFRLFATERPRPVHINIPLSILRGEVNAPFMLEPQRPRAGVDSSVLAKIQAALVAAANPVIVAGGGCRHFAELVVALAERVPCPLITTVAGRGIIPGSHPLSVGAQLRAPEVQAFLRDADFALVLGSELAEPDHWSDELRLPARQVWVNLDAELLLRRAPETGVVADAREVVSSLNQRIARAQGEAVRVTHERCRAVREQLRQLFEPWQHTHWRVLIELQKNLPPECCVCSDMTQLAYTAVDYLPCKLPDSWFHPNGFGTLGYALPAGIGVALAREPSPVLVLVGDAGLQYTMAEMGVAAELGLSIVILLWQNNALQQIADDMAEHGVAAIAVTQQNPDFLALAKSFGWQARKVNGLYDLGPQLEAAFAESSPVLLELDATSV